MPAVLGLRAKTGRAIAVVLAGTRKKPQFVARREISLVDPSMELAEGPYHTVMHLPWSEAMIAVRDLAAAIERVADHAVGALMRERSEEHTSELQSPCNLVCRLLLEKKKKNAHADMRPRSSTSTSPHR